MKYTTKQLICILREWSEEHDGQAPTQDDFNKNCKLPNARTYSRIFGSWNKALKIAGIYIPIEQRLWGYNDGQIAAILINMVRRACNESKNGPQLPYIYVKGVKYNGKIQDERKQQY